MPQLANGDPSRAVLRRDSAFTFLELSVVIRLLTIIPVGAGRQDPTWILENEVHAPIASTRCI